jgi:hypothetical protein
MPPGSIRLALALYQAVPGALRVFYGHDGALASNTVVSWGVVIGRVGNRGHGAHGSRPGDGRSHRTTGRFRSG